MGCPEVDTFNRLVAGRLDAETRAALADHAASCDDCRGLLGALLDVTAATEAAGPRATRIRPPRDEHIDRIDRYVIERKIGAGAMGVVYAARDPELERPVAIKLLRGGGSAARLKREAQMLARLHHPNVVAVHDVGEHDGQTFVAMALVDGENLRAWLAEPRGLADILREICDAARGVAAAHAAGLIHRDLKPDNIFVARDGGVQVGDFGLARAEGERDVASGGDGPLELTATGMVLGTPAYMAPEHAAGAPTPASDQFSLCVTAWEALYGQRPFVASSIGELQDAIAAGRIARPPDARDVPVRVRAAIERGLRADPAERWPSVAALIAALAPRRRRWPVVAALAAAGVAGIALYLAGAARTGTARPDCTATVHELDDVDAALAGSAAAPVRVALTEYTRDWRAARRDACLAPHGPAATDPRVLCLDRVHEALRGLVAELPGSDPERLADVVAILPQIGDCKAALDDSAAADVRLAGTELLGKIESEGMRLELAGSGDVQTLRTLEADATRLGYEPAIAAALFAEAGVFRRTAQPDAAAEVLRRALAAGEASHDDRAVARAAIRLAAIEVAADRLDSTRTLIELASAALARAGGDAEIELELVGDRARLAAASGDHEAAIALVRDAIARMTARRGADSAEVMELQVMLSRELTAAGRMAEAGEAMSRANVSALARLDTFGIRDVVDLERRTTAAMLSGEIPRATELAHELAALADKSGDDRLRGEAALTLAQTSEIARDGRAMIDAYQHALDVFAREGAAAPLDDRGQALEGIGLGWLLLHQPAAAIAPLRQAIELDKGSDGPAFADQRASATIELAWALEETGKPHDARLLLEPLVRELADTPTALPQRRGAAEYWLAVSLWEDGGPADRARARALAEDSERDLRAGLERLKTWPPALTVALRERLADVVAWRKRHP